jgi:hypothetical protein
VIGRVASVGGGKSLLPPNSPAMMRIDHLIRRTWKSPNQDHVKKPKEIEFVPQ